METFLILLIFGGGPLALFAFIIGGAVSSRKTAKDNLPTRRTNISFLTSMESELEILISAVDEASGNDGRSWRFGRWNGRRSGDGHRLPLATASQSSDFR